MMTKKTIRFCPVCGKKTFTPYQNKAFRCNACDFLYYHNVAATSSAIISTGDEILLVKRANDPCQGMLDLPGGFVEEKETAEQGLLRELNEELGVHFENQGDYLCSFSNHYEYKNVLYNTLDLFFVIRLDQKPVINVNDDVSDFLWLQLTSIDLSKIAFDSIRNAIHAYRTS